MKNPNINAKDYYGNTALHHAVENNDFDIVETLVKGVLNVNLTKEAADVNVQNEFGHTPLYIATACGNTKIAKFLLENNADVNNQDNCDGATPLHLAASGNHSNAALWLIKYKADVNLKDCRGETPLD